MNLNQIAEAYVKLVLAVGQHDDSYVDAYIGPTEWREQMTQKPLVELKAHADELLEQAKIYLPLPLTRLNDKRF